MAYRIKTSDGSLLAEEPEVAMKAFEVLLRGRTLRSSESTGDRSNELRKL